jgi:hypothetical protein
MLVQIGKECTPSYLFTGKSNLFQPAQAEAVLGQRSTYLTSWVHSFRYTVLSGPRYRLRRALHFGYTYARAVYVTEFGGFRRDKHENGTGTGIKNRNRFKK